MPNTQDWKDRLYQLWLNGKRRKNQAGEIDAIVAEIAGLGAPAPAPAPAAAVDTSGLEAEIAALKKELSTAKGQATRLSNANEELKGQLEAALEDDEDEEEDDE